MRDASEMMRVGVFFSPEKRVMMWETKERERERKREREKEREKLPRKRQNQKPKNSFFFFFFFFFLHALHSCFASHTRAQTTNRPTEKMGKKGTASSSKTAKKKKQSPGAAAKTPSLPNKASDSYFFSFLSLSFLFSFVVGLRCVR